ncbi:ATP-binding protein [Bacillus sp. PK3_68]|uniref:ATP-binding protein n=1 Tax=Bacillus sp. PK3_68 TaxID=2027408 RepID=UPI000E759527|nr:ATP-binding protein [Bacillus sp. PK3_68]RJS59056.1 hypothetical protein CJ483_02430 [Bacillus sp. PK3_68]
MEKMNICFDALKTQCQKRGLDPLITPEFKEVLNEKELQQKRLQHTKFLQVVDHFFEKFISSMQGVPILTATADKEGYVIQMLGDQTIKDTVNQLGIREGVQFTEEICGMNSVILALKYDQPIEMIGTDHYHHCLHSCACYGVAIKDPIEGGILGAITFMTTIDQASPLLLTLLLTMKDSIERELQLLKQNEKLYILNKLMMDTTRNGMMISNKEGKLIGFNLSAEQITGLKREEVFFQPINKLGSFGAYLNKVLGENKQYTDLEISFVQKSGQETTVLFDALPIRDEQQKLTGAFAQIKDITGRKKTEELLLNTEKLAAIGQMAAGVAHEIRNPLTTIRGFIQLVKEDFKEESHFQLILEEIDRINFIVSELLILSKPNVVHFHNKNLNKILKETISLFQTQASMSNIQMATEFANSELMIHCNKNQLKQVFINLFKNSVEAMPFGGQLTIRVGETKDREARIQIIDEGEGMKPEQIQKLGTPFYTTKETGTGLGYMIIKRIIEQHKGRLNVSSKVNKGTVVEITLPLIGP